VDHVVTPQDGSPVDGSPVDGSPDDGLATFCTERPRLLRLATRVLGDDAAADDVVQEAWIRWQRTDRDDVRNPAAFLTTATTRLALTARRTAWSRHEQPTADPLPPRTEDTDPGSVVESRDDAATALAVVLDRLRPAERAAWVLRTAFGYPYARIADVLGVTAPHARQLVARATAHLDRPSRPSPGTAPRPATGSEARRTTPDALVPAFLDASRTGDLRALEQALLDDVPPRAA